MAVRLVSRFDGDLDLVVGGPLAFHPGGLDCLLLADAAPGGVQVGEAGQQRQVVFALAFLALAKAVEPVDQIRILSGRLVGAGHIGLVTAGELAGVEHRSLFDAGPARASAFLRRPGCRLADLFTGSEGRQRKRETQAEREQTQRVKRTAWSAHGSSSKGEQEKTRSLPYFPRMIGARRWRMVRAS